MKTCTATAETFMRTASSMLTAICSLDSSLRMLGPPLARMTTALVRAGWNHCCKIHGVSIKASAYGKRQDGHVDAFEPVVGSLEIAVVKASITVLPDCGLKIRADDCSCPSRGVRSL